MPVKRFDTSKVPQQRRFMESVKPELLLSGAFGAGKSRPGCEKGLFLSLKYPGNVGAIIRKTYKSLTITTMKTFLRDVCPPEYIASSNMNTGIFRLNNGSEVLFTGLDDPEKIGSLELGWAFVDEMAEITEDDYIMLLGRLRLTNLLGGGQLPFRQLMGATNPAAPTHFLYRYFFLDEAALPEQEKRREVLECNSLQNPFTPPDYKEALKKFTGVYYQRYVLGKWIGYEGLVYDNWDPQQHVVEGFEIPGHWPRYRVIDFGYTNPFCCQWWCRCPEAEETHLDPLTGVYVNRRGAVSPIQEELKGYYLYREIYKTRREVAQHAVTIKRWQEPVIETIADWDAEDRATLESAGIPTSRARKEISVGIQAVHTAISENRFHIFRGALVEEDVELRDKKLPCSTLEEFGNYYWSKRKLNRNEKEMPQDKDNHGMDCLRYLIMTLENPGGFEQEAVVKTQPSPLYQKRNWDQYIERKPRWRDV